MNPLLNVLEYVKQLAEREGIELTPAQPPNDVDADIAFPVGFKLAAIKKRRPEECADEFAQQIEHSLVERAFSLGGYVNIKLNRPSFAERVINAALKGSLLVKGGRGRRVVIDYSSPNVAKPMHVGHLRSTVAGEALKRIHRALGYDVVGINYLGDVGTQFGKLIYALRWAKKDALEKNPIRELLRIYVVFHKEAEKRPELEEKAKEIYAELEKGDEKYVELWKWIRDLSLKGFERIYKLLGVEFDEVTGESAYIETAKKIAEKLMKMGVAERDEDGSIIVNLEKYGLGKDVLIKKDGSTLYLSRDLAALLDRVERYAPEKIIYVVGSEQKMHFKRLFKLAEILGVRCTLIHAAFGLIHLPEGRISTRKGRVVFLEDVLARAIELARKEMEKRGGIEEEDAKKIGVGAVVYSIIKVEMEKPVEFDWKKILAFEGETGPYIQYAAVRAKNILNKVADYKFSHKEKVNDDEWKIIMDMAWYPLYMNKAARLCAPNVIARYTYDLARDFHNFYEKHRVLNAEKAERSFRLGLVDATYKTLSHAMKCILLDVPRRM